MEVFIALVSLIIGFFLNVIKEYFFDRPIIKANLKDYHLIPGTEDDTTTANYDSVEVYITIDVYNIGRSPTAIKNISMLIEHDNKSYKDFPVSLPPSFSPTTSLKSVDGKIFDLAGINLPPGSVKSIALRFEIPKTNKTFRIQGETINCPITLVIVDIFDKKIKLFTDLYQEKSATDYFTHTQLRF